MERSWRAGTNTFNKTTEKYGKMPTQSIINVLYYSIRVRHRDEFADCQAGLLSGIIAGCHVVESQRQIRRHRDGRPSKRPMQQAMLCRWPSIECVPSPQDTSGPQVGKKVERHQQAVEESRWRLFLQGGLPKEVDTRRKN